MNELVVSGHHLEARWVGPEAGSGRSLVLLHEGLGSARGWRDFPERLVEATGLGALVYSRLGYGESDAVPLPRPLSYMHDEALVTLPEVLQAVGVREPVLVGHSDGASIALLFAGSGLPAAATIAGLVTMAPHVFVEDISVQSIAAAAEAFRTGDLRARLARQHGDNVDGAFWGWNGAWLDPGFRSWNIEATLPRVRASQLVIQGAEDPYGTLAQVASIETKSGGPVSRLVLSPCGHAPFRDQPEATIEAVARFVRSIGGA